MYHDVDNDFMRAWQLLIELSEQNALNHKMSANLHGMADALKVILFPTPHQVDLNEHSLNLE
jgi:hypothetical protein